MRRIAQMLREDDGMATTEYALVTVAAAAFAGLLIAIIRSDEVREPVARRDPVGVRMSRGHGDRGSVTAEMALVIPAAVLVLALMLATLTWALTHLTATDLAGVAAREAAVDGHEEARAVVASRAADATVGFSSGGGWVTATVEPRRARLASRGHGERRRAGAAVKEQQ
ncbi:DUF4244 domain-containing protein [Demequina litorisediminis]|uniref:TadE-like protein n=1 Tax=Demequina litorisediminis TaxID=1849022 RepID=A0ABQ6IEV9_9MICO|nr:DUF4244 domain-containing protein [Demequina litorisediminis]GMA35264.1 hypothetical protein GCM10025876_14680 [Demequina litorisediminis]